MNMNIGMGSAAMMSPRAMMDKRIDAAVQAGSISATDETALDSALDAIDSALGVGSSGSTAKAKLDPAGMGDRIDALIDQQVTAGTLTQEQAATLQSLFAQNAPPEGQEGSGDTAMSGIGGVGGGRCPMGPPPPPPYGTSDSEDAESSSADATTDQIDALIAFLETMREQMATQNSYSAAGSTVSASDSSTSGLIVDALA